MGTLIQMQAFNQRDRPYGCVLPRNSLTSTAPLTLQAFSVSSQLRKKYNETILTCCIWISSFTVNKVYIYIYIKKFKIMTIQQIFVRHKSLSLREIPNTVVKTKRMHYESHAYASSATLLICKEH